MYERFTDRVRKVMVLANSEAHRLKHEYIGTEHILLGLVKEGGGMAIHVLQNLGLDPRRIRLEIERLIQDGIGADETRENPMTPRAKEVLERAIEESRNWEHGQVGTEHILLGLLRVREGVAAQILMKFGVTAKKLRVEVEEVLHQPNAFGRKELLARPPMQPAEGGPGRLVEPPGVCPKCGDAQVVRVLWHWVPLFGKDQEDVTAGKAILASQSREQGPSWVCLRCTPAWSVVHRLALHEHEWQLAKENALASQDFETAVKCRDAQGALRRRLDSLLEGLLGTQ